MDLPESESTAKDEPDDWNDQQSNVIGNPTFFDTFGDRDFSPFSKRIGGILNDWRDDE